MPSLALRKLFQSKKDRGSDSDNLKNEKSKTTHKPGTKARIASLTDTFRRRTRVVPATVESESNVAFQSQIPNVVPLPHIPQVSGTLRRDLAQFKPLPFVHYDESEGGPESSSFVDKAHVSAHARPSPVAPHAIRRYPVSMSHAVDNQTPATDTPLASNNIRRKPVPVPEPLKESCSGRTFEEGGTAVAAKACSTTKQIATKNLVEPTPDGPHALIISSDAAASRLYSPVLNVPSSPRISLSQFPVPPTFSRIQQTSYLAPSRARALVQTAREAAHEATTAVEAQQALLDLADISATKTTSTIHHDHPVNGHRRGSSEDTALTLYTPPSHDELEPVESERRALTAMVSGFCLSRVTPDAQRQNDSIRALQSEKAEALAEKESLTMELAKANLMVRVELAKQEQFQRQVEEAQDARRQICKEKTQLVEERDVARSMAEESAAAAKKSDNHNKELFGKIASREYEICQTKIVLDKNKDFLFRTGHTADEWYQRVMSLTQAHLELSNQHAHCEANISELVSQLTRTADVLAEATKALKQCETEAWKFKHLYEEEGRALEVSQKMQKDTNELVEILQKDNEAKEVALNVEKRCAERLLADTMRENAAKDKRIAQLCSVLSTSPSGENDNAKLLDTATMRLGVLEEQTITSQRAAEDALKLLSGEKAKSAALSQANRVLEDKLGQVQMELDISGDEKAVLKGELAETQGDLEVTEDNARLWQMVAEQHLDQLSPEEHAETKGHALAELRKQLELAQRQAQYFKHKNKIVREDAADLEYELQLHQRRLANDAGQELFYYQTHWEKVERIFDENQESKARLEAFEYRFAAELAREPLQLTRDPLAHKSFEEVVGPESVAQTIALMKCHLGSHDSDNPCLTEKVHGVYGFGPAGLPDERTSVEMPEGYLERKAMREATEEDCQIEGEWEDCDELDTEPM